jgi:hypothetical protein
LTLIAGSAAVAVVATGALLFSATGHTERHVMRVGAPVVEVRIDRSETRVIEAPLVASSGAERLYGTVETLDGDRVEGFIRWDKNEGSWADLLDALKWSGRRVSTQTGVRFGHIARIEAAGDRSAWVEMRTGESFELRGESSDLGRGMRALTVEPTNGDAFQFSWDDLAEITFEAAPADATSFEQRLHGTVATESGLEFTGYVTWDIDEIYSSDVLDGEADGREIDVPFGAIASIERVGHSASRVTLHDGEVLMMSGSNDVDDDNSGITISDPQLGQVKVEWGDFDQVRFFPPAEQVSRDAFDGGRRITGTVIGSSGDSWTGAVTWDRDEAWGWEIINGQLDDAEFFVEFGQVSRIERTDRGARVTLLDGRVLELDGSQDVGSGHRGIRIGTGGGAHDLEWEEFRELRIQR